MSKDYEKGEEAWNRVKLFTKMVTPFEAIVYILSVIVFLVFVFADLNKKAQAFDVVIQKNEKLESNFTKCLNSESFKEGVKYTKEQFEESLNYKN